MALSKEALLATKGIGTEEVEVPGVGTVVVRGLSRSEVVALVHLDADVMEIRSMVDGMVDPSLTFDEVEEWRKEASSEVIRPISDAILTLSGLAEGARHEAERQFRPRDE